MMKYIYLILIVLIAAFIVLSCENPGISQKPDDTSVDPKVDLFEVEITSTNQSHTFPSSYFTEKTQLESDAAAEKRSWRDLYEVGAITATKYEEEIAKIDAQLAVDLQNLDEKYLAMDIYGAVIINFRITNNNDVLASANVYFKVTTSDSTEFQDYTPVSNIPSNSYLSKNFTIQTENKKATTISFDRITLY